MTKMATSNGESTLTEETVRIGPLTGKIKYKLSQYLVGCVGFCQNSETEEFAFLFPGELYINGSRNLVNVMKCEQLLVLLLHQDLEINFFAERLTHPKKYVVTDAGSLRPVDHYEKHTDKHFNIGYVVTGLWIGMPSLPEDELNAGSSFLEFNHSFDSLMIELERHLFSVPSSLPDVESGYRFFLVTGGMNHFKNAIMPAQPTKKNLSGIVREIHRPTGGIIDTAEDGPVFFHRSRCYIGGMKLRVNAILEDNFVVGDNVTLDVVPNELNPSTHLAPQFSHIPLVAHKVYKFNRPDEKECFEEEILSKRAFKSKVIRLFETERGAESGLAVVQAIGAKGTTREMVGKRFSFDRGSFIFVNASLQHADLSYFINVGDDVMALLEKSTDSSSEHEYRATNVWMGRQKTGKSEFSFGSQLQNEAVLSCSLLNKLYVPACNLESILFGQKPPRAASCPEDFVLCHVTDLFMPTSETGVDRALLCLDSGTYCGKLVVVEGKNISLFGQSFGNVDLQYVLKPGTRMVCRLPETGGELPENSKYEVSTRAHVGQFTPDRDEWDPLVHLSQEERDFFAVYLTMLRSTYDEFRSIVNSKPRPKPKIYLPFPKDLIQGRVISFDTPKGHKGCMSGTIVVEFGYYNHYDPKTNEHQLINLEGKKVTFHRGNFWIFGHKMNRADLAYIVKPFEKVMFEVEQLTKHDKEGTFKHLPQDVDYRATLVWLGSSRPKNDKPDPGKNDLSFHKWLGKKMLDYKMFQELYQGKLQNLDIVQLSGSNFYLPPEENVPSSILALSKAEAKPMSLMSISSQGMYGNVSAIFQQEPMITHLLDTAFLATGPDDPTLENLIVNDDMAQVAHHVSQALEFCLGQYKAKKMSARGGYMGNDMSYNNAFSGGYNRPSKKFKKGN